MQVKPQTNPKPQGMENFLTQSPSLNPQPEEKMKVQTNPKPSNPSQKTNKVENHQIEQSKEKEIEQIIEQLEQKLKNVKELELSTFNNIVYNKHLIFKLLFIREKIYTIVRDSQTNKSVIVSISPPRWGGSSLRYLINNCAEEWCRVTEKKTSKGTVLSYTPITSTPGEDESKDIDIFD